MAISMAFMAISWFLSMTTLLAAADSPDVCTDCEDVELLQFKDDQRALDFWRYVVLPVQGNSCKDFLARKRVKLFVASRVGGTRAMSGTVGQLRALKDMNLLNEVDQLLTISGAAWAASIYLYASKEQFSEEALLGTSTFGNLQSLTLEAIRTPNGAILKAANISFDTYFAAALQSIQDPNKWWETVIGGAYLCPFGLNGEINWRPGLQGLCNNSNKNQLFVENKLQLVGIKLKTKGQLDTSDALIRQRTHLDSFIMQSCLLSPVGYEPKGDSVTAVAYSPDYSGSPFFTDEKVVNYTALNFSCCAANPDLKNVVIGGGLVESYAFQAVEEPERERDRPYLGRSRPLPSGSVTLQQAVAYSSALFAATGLTSLQDLNFLTGGALSQQLQFDPFLLTPKRDTWPVAREMQGDDSTKGWYMGDGGLLDNGGLPDAIRRGAECTVVLLNNIRPIDRSVVGDWCNPNPTVTANPDLLLTGNFGLEIDAALYDYFGIAFRDPVSTFKKIGFDFTNNQLFEKSLIFDLFCEATTLTNSGKPAVVLKEYTTLENKHWGIQAGKEVRVLFVFTEITTDWIGSLPLETQVALRDRKFDSRQVFGNPWPFPFPHLSTFQPQGDPAQSTAISNEQANLYASLTEYSLRVNEEKIRQCMR